MAADLNLLSESERLRIIEEVIADPRYPRPPRPLTKEEKMELFAELVRAGTISSSYRIPKSERLRILDALLARPDCPIPQAVARSLSEEARLGLFDQLVEGGAIKLG